MEKEENRSRIRDRDWLYNALWLACGDKRIPKCSMNIPVTVIFHDGLPFKAVETDRGTGFIERLDLSHDRFVERQLGEVGFQGLQDRQLRALRKVLLEFSDLNQFNDAQKEIEEPYITKVPSPFLRCHKLQCDTMHINSAILIFVECDASVGYCTVLCYRCGMWTGRARVSPCAPSIF